MSWGRPWLARDYEHEQFILDVAYLTKHLDAHDRRKVTVPSAWQEQKTQAVRALLERGKNPGAFDPVRLVLHKDLEEFRVEDGISRLRAFSQKGIGRIRAIVRPGEW